MNLDNLLARQLAREILAELGKQNATSTLPKENAASSACSDLMAPIGISNRHVHLSRHDMDALFGPGSELTRMKAVKQPGQYAAEETVTLKGPKGEIARVRVLGPLRPETQIEISVSDGIKLGVKAPVRMSGKLDQSPGLELIGPAGSVKTSQGTIVAWRHVHMRPETAASAGFRDGESIDVEIKGPRGGILSNVIVRASAASELEMHIDIEEANAFLLRNNDLVRLIKRS